MYREPDVRSGCISGFLKFGQVGFDPGRVTQQGVYFYGLLVMGHGLCRGSLRLVAIAQLDVVLGHTGMESNGSVCGQGLLKMFAGGGRIALGQLQPAERELDFGL